MTVQLVIETYPTPEKMAEFLSSPEGLKFCLGQCCETISECTNKFKTTGEITVAVATVCYAQGIIAATFGGRE